MYMFGDFLSELNENTGINFSLIGEDGVSICEYDFNKKDYELIYFPIFLGKNKTTLIIDKKYEECLPILKFTIENKYKELYSIREQFLIDILEKKEVSADKLDKNIPFLSKGCNLFLISLEGSRCEGLNIIKQLYNDQDVISVIYEDEIVVVGHFDEQFDHAYSIKESIVSDLYCKCYVSYANIAYDSYGLKKAYSHAKECMSLGKKFNIKNEVFNYNKMLFEKVVYNIDTNVKNELLMKFKNKFNSFDNEMVITIEEFVNCGLNVSDAAKRLYIHRNTLIYRLDKIEKETGFDIRVFKEATVFIIAFLVWKERNSNLL